MKSRKITLKDTKTFDRGDFDGNIFISDEDNIGLNAFEVHVHGKHPLKIIEGKTRIYRVESGTGTFTLDGETHTVQIGDVYIISNGSTYEYEGNMVLWEMNVIDQVK